jgi:hypothetical protein
MFVQFGCGENNCLVPRPLAVSPLSALSSGEQTANAAEAWKSLQANLIGFTNALKPIATVFEQTAGRWETITQAQFEAAKSLQQTLKELRTVTNKRKRRGGLLGWLTGSGSDEVE